MTSAAVSQATTQLSLHPSSVCRVRPAHHATISTRLKVSCTTIAHGCRTWRVGPAVHRMSSNALMAPLASCSSAEMAAATVSTAGQFDAHRIARTCASPLPRVSSFVRKRRVTWSGLRSASARPTRAFPVGAMMRPAYRHLRQSRQPLLRCHRLRPFRQHLLRLHLRPQVTDRLRQ